MKALVLQKFGLAEHLKLVMVNRPVPQMIELLIELHATSMNAADWPLMCHCSLYFLMTWRRTTIRQPALFSDRFISTHLFWRST